VGPAAISVLYDPINDFCLKQCLKKKIGQFMERKERNAEGKTSVCQITSFISAMSYKIFTKKVYIIKVYISNVVIFKNEKVFSKIIF
jgi:hypothetical protein